MEKIEKMGKMEEKKFIVINGLIDGHDKKQATVYGAFLGVVSMSGVEYVGSLFSFMPISRDMTWFQLLGLLREEKESSRDAALAYLESQLENFLKSNKEMLSTAKNMNGKQLERSVSFFCAQELGLRSVTLVEITITYKKDLSSLFAPQEEQENNQENNEAAGKCGEDETDSSEEVPEDGDGEPGSDMLSVSCEPVFDPVSGVAVTDLGTGTAIICRLSEESVYYQLFANRLLDFDGSIKGEVTGIKINEYGTAVVGLSLAEGISGVMKLSGSVRIRLADRADKTSHLRKNARSRRREDKEGLPPGLVFGVAVILLLLCLMGALVYFFS